MNMIAEAPATTAAVAAPVEAVQLTGSQKAAILLVALGEQASAPVVKLLTADELKAVTRAIAELHLITAQQAQGVIEEFYEATVAHDFPHRGGAEYAKRMLTSAFGREESGRIASELDLEPGAAESEAESLRQTNPKQLAKLVKSEHPQTIAIILSHLGKEQAAALLSALDQKLRAKVIMRLATLDNVSEDVIRKVAMVLAERVKSLGEIKKTGTIGGIRSAAELLNAMDPALCEEVLVEVREQKEALEERIRECMFVFDDLLNIDSKGIKELIAKVDRKVLTVALKGTSESLKDHFFGCLSQRGADMMREDMEAMGAVKIKDVDAAQRQIINVVRMLQADGVLSAPGKGNDEYVE